MALQAAKVEIAFTTTPFVDPSTLTWTDVSSYVLPDLGNIRVTRGRQYEQTSMQAGTVSFVLDNRTGNFDPDNASGAYYPLVLPMLPVRISSTFSAVTYVEFFGFIESWQQTWDGSMLSQAVVTANDGMKTVLAFALGLGYTEQLVKDYGGTIGTQDDFVWPFQAPNHVNSYLNTAPADVVAVGNSDITGIAETGIQLTGSGSSFYWTIADIGARGYWLGFDGWLRIDTNPTGAPRCMVFNGSSNDAQGTPNLGFGPQLVAGGSAVADTLSAWVINYPQNLLASTLADPTTTTGWTASGTGASIATATITASNGRQRIYLDNGATDFYGATKTMRLTAASTATVNLLSPFTNVSASTAYTIQFAYTAEQTTAGLTQLTIDWYNGATFLSSTTVLSTASLSAGTYDFINKVTSPASTTKFQLHANIAAAAGNHFDFAQIIAATGTFDCLTWYAGGTTPSEALLITVASYGGTAPPGQSNSATGWPCYTTVAVPAAGTWFHLAIDTGQDNAGTPFAGTATRGMPSCWVNGVAVRMWTTGPWVLAAANAQPWAAIGAKLFYNGSGTPSIQTASELAMSADELYIPDQSIAAAGEVTAAKALAHYSYGLTRHDYLQQLTGARINAVLDSMGWPSVQRAIDTGTCTIQAQLPDTTGTSLTGTTLIADAVGVEGGLFYIARDGKATFWDQAHAAGGSPAITVGDGSGSEIPYQVGPTVSKDDTYIYNQVTLTKTVTDGASANYVATAMDATSQGQYKVRQLTNSAPWETNADMDALAASIVTDYKTPSTRIANVSVEGVTSAAFASLLPRDIGDYIAVKIRPRSSGPTITVNAYIQGIALTVTSTQWLWTFALSPTLAGH